MNVVFPREGDALEVILKVTGDVCNINCHYCYEKRRPKERNEFLPLETVRRFLQHAGGRPLSIGIHGGEPTLYGRERMRELLDLLYHEYSGRVEVKVQTNATQLDDAWIDLFSGYENLTLGISLDGHPESNAHRVTYRNEGTSAAVERALVRLGERGVNVGVICVVTARALGNEATILHYFAGFPCIRAVNFAPCFDFNAPHVRTKGKSQAAIAQMNPGTGMPAWAITPMQFARFLHAAYEEWKEHHFESFTVEPLLSFMRVLGHQPPDSCHFTPEKCAYVLTIYPDGRIGSCDEISNVTSTLGTVGDLRDLQLLLRMRANPVLEKSLADVLADCEPCEYKSTCGGGCLATRMRYKGTALYEEYCAYRTTIIDLLREDLRNMEVI